MAGRKNSEFTEKVKRTLAGRAGFVCSFPDCRLFLIGPHMDGDKIVNLGVAAHIKGAAPGSARYDKDQTTEQRKDISNGIWMCRNHSVQIDINELLYPERLLYEWKAKREEKAELEFAKVKAELNKPSGTKRPEERLRLDTDGKYRSGDLTVSFDPFMAGDITNVQLSVEGKIGTMLEMIPLAASSVQAYLVSVGLRGQYFHILSQIQNFRHVVIEESYPEGDYHQYELFKEHFTSIDWSFVPGIEGKVFDLVAGDVDGSREARPFMIDITCLYPAMYSEYMDSKD